ncbi:MAG: DUF2029 domain-containing protein [Acidobacteriota bacterium]|nr:DUF2029 domain-containing protein [Acidobacteriota bacterium]MDQ3420231.1 DUF2029 domain-containing protein [Acidobacteriota bacterium]
MIKHVALAVGLCAVIADGVARARPTGELRDFGSFMGSGQAGIAGENPYGIHPLTFHVVLPGFDVWNPNLNPPVSVPLFGLLWRLGPQHAFVLWWGISLLCFIAAVTLLVRRYGQGPAWLLPLWAVALAGMWDTLALGQIYLPLVLATVGSWLLLERGRYLVAGVLMGIVIAVKPNFAVWPVILLLAGHVRTPLTAAITAALLSVIPVLTHGPRIYRQWVDLVASDTGRAAFLTNASIPGLALRLDAGLAGIVLSIVLLTTLALWAVRQRPAPLQASALGILGGIAASPIAWVHYTLFLLPVFFSRRWTPPITAAAALLIVPVHVVLQFLDAPLWQQVTAGSIYNWAVVLCLTGLGLREARETTHHHIGVVEGTIPAARR